jgi:hypothetical protein
MSVKQFENFDCRRDSARPLRRLFVIGDSHAGAYKRMLGRYANERAVSVWLYSGGGCSVANLLRPDAALSSECAAGVKASISDIVADAKPGDAVLIASLRMNLLSDQWATHDVEAVKTDQENPDSRRAREQALDDASKLIRELERHGLRVIIDAPKPVFAIAPFRCSDWFNSRNTVCSAGFTQSRVFLLDFREPIMASLRRLMEQHENLAVWDPFPILCPNDPCSAFDRGKPLFFDGHHLSGYGNDVLYADFSDFLEKHW